MMCYALIKIKMLKRPTFCVNIIDVWL